ncbi:MAG: tetratricopeptide repeat protein [Pyrinomonadaceae bacterium]
MLFLALQLIPTVGYAQDERQQIENIFKANGYEESARQYGGQGNHQAAVKDFTKAINLNPTFILALSGRAESYIALKEYEAAIKDLTIVIEVDPDREETYLARSQAYLRLDKVPLAQADTSKFVKMKTARLFKSIRGYARKENHDMVIRMTSEVIELDPNNAEAYEDRGEAYHAMGKSDLALADFNKSLQIDPETGASAYRLRAEIYIARNQNDLAAADYRAAAKRNQPPLNIQLLEKSSAIDIKQKKYDGAATDYKAIIEILEPLNEPKLAQTIVALYTERGRLNSLLGKLNVAVADFAKALALDPKNSSAYHFRGHAYENNNRYDLAVADFTAAIGLSAESSEFLLDRSNVYMKQKKFAAALADLNKVFQIKPDDVKAISLRAKIYCEQNNKGAAAEDEKRVLDLGGKLEKKCQ